MVNSGGPVSCWRLTFNLLISRIRFSAYTHPDNFPRCWCLGGRKALVDAWGLIPDDARALLVDADLKSAPPSTIDLGPKPLFSVAESVLLTARFGPRFCAQVAEGVSLGVVSKNYSKMTAVAKDVSATRYTHYTATSIANYLRSPVFGKHPKLVRKNTKAAAVEAAEIAAEAEGTACMEETKRLAAEYEAMGGGAGTEALAQAAELGDLLRERWSAHTLLRESDRRAARFGELMSVREAVATEMAATNAAVAAAATAAAARCFESRRRTRGRRQRRCRGKRATRPRRAHALEKKRPAERARRRRGIHGRRGLFLGCGVWSGGPGPRPRGDGVWVIAAPRHGLQRGHRDGLRPQVFARASTRRIPRPYIRGRICINS
jgi:hypothetical protein